MATSTPFFFPNFRYGFLPEYFENGNTQRRINLRPGQWVAINPALAPVQNSAYTSRGITHLINNTGGGLDASINVAQRAGMDNGEFVSDALGWQHTTWSDTAIQNQVNSHVQDRQGKLAFYLDQLGENLATLYERNGSFLSISTWNGSSQQRAWAAAMGAKVAQYQGRFYGGYDGHLPNLAFADGIVDGLKNNANAYDLAKRISPFGNDFYSQSAYTYRHGCIKIYQTGTTDMHRFVVGMLMTLQLDRMARRHLETDRRVAVAAFSGYMETLTSVPPKEWTVAYRRELNQGVTVTRTTHPQWSYSLQLFLYTVALLWDFDLYSWESEERYGTNPDVVQRNYNQTVVAGAGVTATYPQDATTVNLQTAGAASYPLNPQGGQDIVPVAAELATWLQEWVGNWDAVFAAH